MTKTTAKDGFILIAVLWILAALATLASVYSVYLTKTAAASHVGDDRLQADESIRAGLELAAYQLTGLPAATRPTAGAFAVSVGASKIKVSYQSEGARIDLNAAPKELLAGLFIAIGAGSDRASTYADRIIGWRRKGELAGQNDEAAAYKSAAFGYAPRQARIPNVLELTLVRDIPSELIARILPFVTVFNGRAEIDPMIAAPEVLAALPGVSPETLGELLDVRARNPHDSAAALARLGPAAARVSIEPRSANRVWVEVDLADGRSIHAETVIIILEGGEEPYRILAWRDDFDQPL